MSPPQIQLLQDAASALSAASDWDCVIWIRGANESSGHTVLEEVWATWRQIGGAHQGCSVLPASALAGARVVLVSTGPLLRERDDVQRFAAAAASGCAKAIALGAKRPIMFVSGVPEAPRYTHALAVAALGALSACWIPLEARESGSSSPQITSIGLTCSDTEQCTQAWQAWINAAEAGRWVARDLCGTEPERMAPTGFAEYCKSVFANGNVNIAVNNYDANFARAYPLLSAVARASLAVERHHPCTVRLDYHPQGPIQRTILLAGKGVTYDTGGADLKVGGSMAGMSRDKGGAAAVAGLMQALSALAPSGVRVIAELGLVRNSIGADAFVSDEIITSHAGKRVRIVNTDAEGRLVLADVLSHLRLAALESPLPELFSIATLTGHAARSIGANTALVDNASARKQGTSAKLEAAGDLFADPFDPQRLRPEDWDFVAPQTAAEDVVSCNNAASSVTTRGHQFPAAFLAIASGLEDGEATLPFTHVDIAGSAVDNGWQHGRPSARPVVGMLAALFSELLPS